jgi:hypothetical protein
MQADQAKEKKKRPYEKPRLRTIELAAEEVLGVGCKTTGETAPYGGPPCSVSNCSQIGT